jgi:hypothetical protein
VHKKQTKTPTGRCVNSALSVDLQYQEASVTLKSTIESLLGRE